MRQEIKANFKQANIKSGTATLQFEVLTSAKGFMETVKMAGSVVTLTVETDQQELPIEELDAEYEPVEGQTEIEVEATEEDDDIFSPAVVALPEPANALPEAEGE